MQIVLATGIYPPDIGGPATYVRNLAKELFRMGNEVSVLTYGQMENGQWKMDNGWKVICVKKSGGPILRWLRYARALKQQAKDADVIEAFSSVSVGVPLWISRLKKPKRILRLGGDFMWERYTDRGKKLGLKEWYERRPKSRWLMEKLLGTFDHIVFSTRFEQELYRKNYWLKENSVIENAVPGGRPELHRINRPLRLLFVGRFVNFKNLPSLIQAMPKLPEANLTLVGDGPQAADLARLVEELELHDRVLFVAPVPRDQLLRIFSLHDLLVMPSITDISPNSALEARSTGLPVLLSKETGLSEKLTAGMVLKDLSNAERIAAAVLEIEKNYGKIAALSAMPGMQRGWDAIASDHLRLFENLLNHA